MAFKRGYSNLSLIHDGTDSLVYRAVRRKEGLPVIIKTLRMEHPPIALVNRYRREFDTLGSLASEGVIKVYEYGTGGKSPYLVFEDFGGESLKHIIARGRLTLREFLETGIKLCRALHDIHGAGIIHRDINPSNVVINTETGQLKIIDFDLAKREQASLDVPGQSTGTMPYISPEQTGRMNRRVDWRTDLYSLGVTFYEMLTGRRPFEGTDPQQLVHDHIARQPIPPAEVNKLLPTVLSDIVIKLLAKNAEDRYQSAIGVSADLDECLRRLDGSGGIEQFPIAGKDVSARFVLPSKIYGREADIAMLVAGLERAAGGRKEMFLVSGAPGVGKTALIGELHRHIAQRNGRFVSSKFDQFVRNIPYSAVIGAFRELVRQLLAESDASLASWRDRIQSALAPNGQVMVDLIPELELIIGPQPPVPALGPEAAQNRFKIVFYDFLTLFCSREHPLVIFLDDLQWADLPSIDLLGIMMSVDNGLLLICAYRDNEVDASHPFIMSVNNISGEYISRLDVQPLVLTNVEEIISDIVHQEKRAIEPLSRLVQKKTGGNPFFVGEFLKTLNSESLLTFDPLNYKWNWDLEQIGAKRFTDNVVELVIGNIGKLKRRTQSLLRYASMLGNVFELERLSVLSETPEEEISRDLAEAVREGFVIPLQDSKLTFSHDRVQQGAYNSIPEGERAWEHLRAGRLLLAGIPGDRIQDSLFVILDQLNKGKELIPSMEEKTRVAELNYQAGRKARESAAFAPAYQFFRTGIDLLGEGSWRDRYEFALAIHTDAAEAAYLSADHDEVERLGEVILKNARTLIDKVPFYVIKINALTNQAKPGAALEMGLEVLKGLDFKVPRSPAAQDIADSFSRSERALRGITPEEIAAFPEATDPRLIAIVRLVDCLVSGAYASSPEILPVLIFNAVYLLVKNRVSCVSSRMLFLVYTNVFLIGSMSKIEHGMDLLRVMDLLADRPDAKMSECVALFGYSYFVVHRTDHLRATIPVAEEAFRAGLKYGDLLYMGSSMMSLGRAVFLAGLEFSEMEKLLDAYTPTTGRLKLWRGYNTLQLRRQSILNLRGSSADPCILSGEAYREEETLPIHQQQRDFGLLFDVFITKAILCLILGRHEDALKNSLAAEPYIKAVTGQAIFSFFHFYDSLIQLAVIEGKSAEERRRIFERVDRNQKVLETWNRHAPMNYGHKILLVKAELSRVKGRAGSAMRYYDKAIRLAGENRYLNEEAIANELAGRFYLERGHARIASLYMVEARYLYERWGAAAKVKDLDGRYPELLTLGAERPRSSTDSSTGSSSSSSGTSSFDLNTVMKAAGAIAREIRLDKLLSELIKIIMESAGAQRGFLILNDEGKLTIEARGSIESKEEPVLGSVPVNKSARLCPAIVYYVERTKKTLVLADASREGNFTHDEYIRREKPLSVLCMPIMNQAALTGILYLENNLAKGAFTPQMVEILTILGSQAAISIENARLYSRLQESESNYRGLYENAVEGIFQTAIDGRVLSGNPSLARIMGFDSPGEMLSASRNVLEIYADKDERVEVIKKLFEKGQVIGHETRLVRRDGNVIWVAISARLVRDRDGSPLCIEGSLIDISAQKEKEMERREREAAEAASRAKGEFLAKMSHEIRTPMNAIIGMTGLALDEALPEKAREYLRITESSAQSLLGLINDILDFSKIEAGKLDMEEVELEIADVMESMADMFGDRVAAKGVELITDIDPKLPRKVMGDPLRLKQILINLVGNAVKFTDSGEIAVSVRLEKEDEDTLTLGFAVEDTGIGIETQKLARLFEAFTQADGSITRQFGGTGLGLTISKRLIELVGGDIWVESSPGEGSTFLFTARLKKSRDNAPVQFEQLARGGKSLVLSGSENLSSTLCRDLQLYGMDAVRVSTAEEAAERLHSETESIRAVFIDAAISDEILPILEQLRMETQYAVFVLIAPALLKATPEAASFITCTLGKPIKRSAIAEVLRRLSEVRGHGRGHGPGRILIDTSDKKAMEGDSTYGGRLKGVRVLMVEDNAINQMLGRIILEGAGMVVSAAEDGLRAVEIVTGNEGQYDIVLMDIQMPGLDGYEATRAIRKDPRFAKLPIIAMTANAMKGDRELCLAAGMNDYVSKPINRDELFSTIEKWSGKTKG